VSNGPKYRMPENSRRDLHARLMVAMVAAGKFPETSPQKPKEGQPPKTVSKPFGVAIWADALVRAHEDVVTGWLEDANRSGNAPDGDQP
jgi:hypothetical protein